MKRLCCLSPTTVFIFSNWSMLQLSYNTSWRKAGNRADVMYSVICCTDCTVMSCWLQRADWGLSLAPGPGWLAVWCSSRSSLLCGSPAEASSHLSKRERERRRKRRRRRGYITLWEELRLRESDRGRRDDKEGRKSPPANLRPKFSPTNWHKKNKISPHISRRGSLQQRSRRRWCLSCLCNKQLPGD